MAHVSKPIIAATEAGLNSITDAVFLAPEEPGVYRFYDNKNRLLYVGKAKILKKRLRTYLSPNRLSPRMRRCVQDTTRVELMQTQTEQEALLLEAALVRSGRPRDNVLLQDGGFHPRLVLDSGPYPRLRYHRGPVHQGMRVLATFGDSASAKRVEEELQRAFGLRTCDENTFVHRSRPCLLYQIGRCSAPCVKKISQRDYNLSVEEAIDFLKQDPEGMRQDLGKRMQLAAESMDFERAARLRDRLRALNRMSEPGGLGGGIPGDVDVMVLVRASGRACLHNFLVRGGRPHGGSARFPQVPDDIADDTAMEELILQAYSNEHIPARILVDPMPKNRGAVTSALAHRAGHTIHLIGSPRGEELSVLRAIQQNATRALERRLAEQASHAEQMQAIGRLFCLKKTPTRIELYDNSHLGGTGMVGAMVIVDTEGLKPAAGRVFRHVGPVQAGDDIGMMRAVLTRRLKSPMPLPDLFLIDGGAVQSAIVRQVLTENNITIPVVGIAKGPNRNAGRERFFTDSGVFDLPKNDPRLFALQRWRDAVHEKALKAQQKLRKKGLKLRLDNISGIGPSRRRALIQRFGSSKGVAEASLTELLQVKGINEDLARKIKNILND